MGKRGGRRKAGVVDGPSSSPFDGRGASFSHVSFCLSLAAEPFAMSRRHRCHAENREKLKSCTGLQKKKKSEGTEQSFLCDAAG